MREIKFRAWIRAGEWEDDGEKQKFIMLGPDNLAYEEYAPISSFLVDVPDEQYIMQYTGLKDKNGVEIYEGDVVVYDGDLDDASARYIVKWSDELAGFNLGDDVPISDTAHLIVLGNIYENPERA